MIQYQLKILVDDEIMLKNKHERMILKAEQKNKKLINGSFQTKILKNSL